MKRKLFILSVFLLIIVVGYGLIKSPRMISADSGFDSSWSSGGESSYSSSSSDSSESGTIGSFGTILLIFFGGFSIICVGSLIASFQIKKQLILNHKIEVSEEEFKKYIDIPIEQFKKERFEDYKLIQEAWMNFDYTCLREKLSDGLYNQYEMQLETLKVKNQVNVMKNIKYIDSIIKSIRKEKNNIIVIMELRVDQNDYLKENNRCIRGSRDVVMQMKYEIRFICNMKENICPNCGGIIPDNTNICSYCRNTVSKNPNNWVMTKKIALYQMQKNNW